MECRLVLHYSYTFTRKASNYGIFCFYNILQCVYCEDNIVPTEDELLKLEDAHYRKIDLSDGIYVVNMDGYIGTSVKKEIEYAERHGKEVLYHYNQ